MEEFSFSLMELNWIELSLIWKKNQIYNKFPEFKDFIIFRTFHFNWINFDWIKFNRIN